MPTIDEARAAEVRAALRVAASGLLNAIRTEIQDGGRFLLVSADLAARVDAEELDSALSILEDTIARRVPSRSDEYSWMLNVYDRGRLITSKSGGWDSA